MRLIDADVLYSRFENEYKVSYKNAMSTMSDYRRGICDGIDWGCLIINKVPTIEAEPLRRGEWDASGRYTFPDGSLAVRCSECGCDLEEHEYKEYWWHYCPVCGAKMDGGEKE